MPQIPDNVLRVEKHGAGNDYEYIFDAKYRINPALPGSGYIDKKPGPEVDTINTMHRYRDAIVYQSNSSPYERTMFGAYVLFPYHNEKEYTNHRFYKSIKQVNIGGLPFLPTATTLVEELLDELVSDSPESAFERTVLPRGIEAKLEKVDWTRRDVLVGSVSSKDKLERLLEGKYYYVDSQLIIDNNFPIRYVALYQTKTAFGTEAKIEFYGEVSTIERVTGFDLKLDSDVADKTYYQFNIIEWKSLQRPIEPREVGPRIMYTNLFLLCHSSHVPELYLNSAEEYRVFYELKRRTEAEILNDNDRVEGISTKKERTSKKDKQEHTMISDRADLIGCCYPDIRDAIICSLTDDKSVYLSFNFDIDSAQGYPEFISAVFHFYEDLDVLEYYALNPKAVLRFEIDNTNSIQGLQIEFQTEFNRVVGPPYLVKLNPGSNHIDIPLSAYSKYTRDMQKIQNLCFVIKKENFVDLKGFVIISNISFVF